MFKYATIAALLATIGIAQVTADEDVPPTFPNIEDNHWFDGRCRIHVKYPGRNCRVLYNRFNDIIDGFSNEDPGEGHYRQRISSPFFKWIQAERIDKSKSEVDQVQWLISQVGNDCYVVGQSAQIHGHLAHRENAYCSVWDVLKYSDTYTVQYTGSCSFVPRNPDHDCVHYPKPWRPSYAPDGDSSFDELEEEDTFLNQ